jgi:hypothetical protein
MISNLLLAACCWLGQTLNSLQHWCARLPGCDAAAAAFADHQACVTLLQIKRTEGVSTTDIVGRMLTCTRVNPHMNKAQDNVSVCTFTTEEDW